MVPPEKFLCHIYGEECILHKLSIRFHSSVSGDAFWQSTLSYIEKQGFSVRHTSSVSTENYRVSGKYYIRFGKLWSLYVQPFFNGIAQSRDADIAVVTTNPFFFPPLLCCLRNLFWRKRYTVALIYDLFPDAMELDGIVSKNGIVSAILARLTAYAIRNSDATVFLGEKLQSHIEQRFGPAKRGVIIPVGSIVEDFDDMRILPVSDTSEISVLYCGNMGRAHDSQTVGDYLNSPSAFPGKICFYASGAGFASLRRRVEDGGCSSRVSFSGPLAADDWKATMKASHVALVTMKPGWENVVMPSKTYSAMAAGQAVIAICPTESDLANLVRNSDCGWVLEPGDVRGLKGILEEQVTDCELLLKKRVNAYRTARLQYSTAIVAKQWTELFASLVD